jgi:hypothetical protein
MSVALHFIYFIRNRKKLLGTLVPRVNVENRFLLLYSLIYAARLLPADTLSVRDVIRWQLAYLLLLFLLLVERY